MESFNIFTKKFLLTYGTVLMVCLEHFSQHEIKEMNMAYLGLGKKEQRRREKKGNKVSHGLYIIS